MFEFESGQREIAFERTWSGFSPTHEGGQQARRRSAITRQRPVRRGCAGVGRLKGAGWGVTTGMKIYFFSGL
ncbi:hypothetical protein [Burkholderia sp. BCC0322]|uniref:hypothetical protein n=1 Tax=unclassified Burkholderia TaxID=2613784 RepID=UPI001589BB12|nr:hypothetical protein [Burkholderia sp. BCC0322]